MIHDFFISASDFLPPGGQIHMGLLDHQGGMNTSKRNEWKRSWMAGLYAAESNLLLTHVLPYEVCGASHNHHFFQACLLLTMVYSQLTI